MYNLYDVTTQQLACLSYYMTSQLGYMSPWTFECDVSVKDVDVMTLLLGPCVFLFLTAFWKDLSSFQLSSLEGSRPFSFGWPRCGLPVIWCFIYFFLKYLCSDFVISSVFGITHYCLFLALCSDILSDADFLLWYLRTCYTSFLKCFLYVSLYYFFYYKFLKYGNWTGTPITQIPKAFRKQKWGGFAFYV